MRLARRADSESRESRPRRRTRTRASRRNAPFGFQSTPARDQPQGVL